MKKKLPLLFSLYVFSFFVHGQQIVTPGQFIKRSLTDKDGKTIHEIMVPGIPPDFRMPVAIPERSAVILADVPAYDWSFGCSATSTAMLAGYYDRTGYPDIYTGPTNGGVAPLDNSVWGMVTINGEERKQCPLSATRFGLDGRATLGHVDDFWIVSGSVLPDPYIGNWTMHPYDDCTGDYMGTNQSNFGNCDGSTVYYFYTDGSPLYNFDASPDGRDGCFGMRQFFESRGYSVYTNYSQYIYGLNGNTLGFTYAQYVQEIDAGRPVIIHVAGHSMLGFGYDPATNLVYLHDTWDYSNHTMVWGESYADMRHYGVTTIRLMTDAPSILLLEDWSSAGFDANAWEINPPYTNWQITNTFGNPVPAAMFFYDPVLTNYESVLLSKSLDATGITDNITFQYDLLLINWSSETTEGLAVEVWDGMTWQLLINHTNADGNIDWTTETFNITQQAAGRSFQLRFRAYGENSYNIDEWVVDNIKVYRQTLNVNPSSLAITVPRGEISTRTITLNNSGDNTLDWSGWVAPETKGTTTPAEYNDQSPEFSLLKSTRASSLSINPPEGSLPAGDSQDVTLFIDATALDVGSYSGSVSFSGDPSGCTVTIPVTINVNLVPDNRTIPTTTIHEGESLCYDALQTMTVAGSGNTFDILNGGTATLIAGQNIRFLEGTSVHPGGYLWGYITTNDAFCLAGKSLEITANPVTFPENRSQTGFSGITVYPNPTSGSFSICISDFPLSEQIHLKVYNIMGKCILEKELINNPKQLISLGQEPDGIYLLHLRAGNYPKIIKIIKSH